MGIGPNIVLWLGSWAAMIILTPHINLITIQDGSEFYADMRALGTIYTNNRSLEQDLRLAARMRRRRPLLSVPDWPLPWWEAGRWVIAQVLTPRQLMASVAVVRQLTLFGQSDSGREVRTVVMTIMFATAMVHNMQIFFAIPAILVWLSLRRMPIPWRAPHHQHKNMTNSRI